MISGSPTEQNAQGADKALRAVSHTRSNRSVAVCGGIITRVDSPCHWKTEDHSAGRQVHPSGGQSRAAGMMIATFRAVNPGWPAAAPLYRPAGFSRHAMRSSGCPAPSIRSCGRVGLPPGQMILPSRQKHPAVRQNDFTGKEKSSCRLPFPDQQAVKTNPNNPERNTSHGQIRLPERK